ncbi:MAG: DUF4398 domain-containing protein [Treponema sp.]|jgi:hypothetical protein|nr:DUF4398 domain-containing protein [Treponema sp.]
MKTTPRICICAILVLAALVMGCAKPPTEEMDMAAEAVTRAENDYDAVTYAKNSVVRAQDALARMNQEAAAKRYDAAKSYAAEAIAAAERAINEGRTGAARARDEAAALVSQLKPLITETGQGIEAARAAKLPLDFYSIDRDFDTAQYNTNEAQSALSGGRYQSAIDRGRSARSGLNTINQQLSVAVLGVSRKK